MSVHTFIDGFNLIRSTAKWEGISKVLQIKGLLAYLGEKKPAGGLRSMITVVFDGYGVVPQQNPSHSLRVIFSGDEDADTIIKDSVDRLKNPRSALVVTNDRAIQRWVRGAGARVLTCEEFLFEKKTSTNRPNLDKPGREAVEKINSELKQIWKLE
jgi:predicted RNA-binding protein with PIN domain